MFKKFCCSCNELHYIFHRRLKTISLHSTQPRRAERLVTQLGYREISTWLQVKLGHVALTLSTRMPRKASGIITEEGSTHGGVRREAKTALRGFKQLPLLLTGVYVLLAFSPCAY